MNRPLNRRQFERYCLNAAFTPVTVRLRDDGMKVLDGHSYDISEGGIQFELDEPIEPGTPVILQVTLPIPVAGHDLGPERSVVATANIVWADDSEPGPVRMAAVFTGFAHVADHGRLMRALSRTSHLRAA